ncbi:Tudor domain-containing protein 6 [Blomia tropicalis]|nr:Tudor domain-containing protein 6 [Blomia tropicalis]
MAEPLANRQSVLITHVESPILFYCRFVTDEEQFSTLERKILEHVNSVELSVPNIEELVEPKKYILVYSVIRQRWCRGRVLSYQCNSELKPINAKIRLIDYGSIEIVLWKHNYVTRSNEEINDFNNASGFCFPCSLGNIKPYGDDGALNKSKTIQHWSSYANYLIEKETKNRTFMLQILNEPIQEQHSIRNIVNCDLLPIIEYSNDNEHQTLSYYSGNICNQLCAETLSINQFPSMSAYLVYSNVARYLDQQNNHQDDVGSGFHSDDEKENQFIFSF